VRPIYHWTPQRIRAHLAISFVAFTLVRHLAVRIKLQYKALSPALIRNALLHVQQSVLQHRSTGERYCIPSNPTAHAQKIYQVMGLKLHTTPFKLTANVVQNFTQSPQCSA
jgi:transposase